jgi:hypothetical protein
MWRRKEITLSFEFDDTELIHKLSLLVGSILDHSREHDLHFRTLIGQHLYENWCENWSEGEKCTLTQFEKRPKPRKLSIDDGGLFAFMYDDDQLFQEHDLAVYGSLQNGAERADLHG